MKNTNISLAHHLPHLHLIDVAHDVRDAKAETARRAIPNYAVDLLEAAKCALSEDTRESCAMLEKAVLRFEEQMPVDSTGTVQTYGESMFAEGED